MFLGQLIVMVSEQLGLSQARPRVNARATEAINAEKSPSRRPEFLYLVIVQGAIASALWVASGRWWMYFALWFLPIVTMGTLCYFVRAFGDHGRLATDHTGPNEGRLITVASQLPWERVFIAPFEFNFHAEHHLYPTVPHQFLPRLHAMIRDKEAYRQQCIVRQSYAAFLLAYWRQIGSAGGVASKTDGVI
jgi:fatty acid desaturase